MSVLAIKLATVLCSVLNGFTHPRKLGLAFAEMLFRLAVGSPQRRPDVAFVSWERSQAAPEPEGEPAAWEVVPNLAVEFVSPTNTADEIEDKMLEYFSAGVDLVWVFYPRQRRVHVFESPTQCRILTEGDALEGGRAIPGFRLPIQELYEMLQPPR